MLEIYACAPAAQSQPVYNSAEFLRLELSAAHDGTIRALLTATTVDEDEPQLLDQEIAYERVASMDDVIALIRAHVHIAPRTAPLPTRLS